jgi:hypothetical protein
VSRGGPGCPCFVCVSVLGPRARAKADRANLAMVMERSARAADERWAAEAPARIEEVGEKEGEVRVVADDGRQGDESESEYEDMPFLEAYSEDEGY